VSPRGSLEYIRPNFRGLGQTLTLSTLLARLDQRLLFTYADPTLQMEQTGFIVQSFGGAHD